MNAAGGQQPIRVNRDAEVDQTPRHSGITLFELLLVLVLLVVVGSMSAPLFEGSFASIRLQRGADQVLAAWTRARTQAIESGQTYQFRFQPQQNVYRIEPWLSGVVEEEPDLNELLTTTADSDDQVELKTWTLESTLPEEIVFADSNRLESDEGGVRTVIRLDQESSAEWSLPILFFPDGSTSTASLLVKNSKEIFCRLTLRPLTGVARKSGLLTREEADRLQSR